MLFVFFVRRVEEQGKAQHIYFVLGLFLSHTNFPLCTAPEHKNIVISEMQSVGQLFSLFSCDYFLFCLLLRTFFSPPVLVFSPPCEGKHINSMFSPAHTNTMTPPSLTYGCKFRTPKKSNYGRGVDKGGSQHVVCENRYLPTCNGGGGGGGTLSVGVGPDPRHLA